MEITNEPVRIDYDLMEVVPADHFERKVGVDMAQEQDWTAPFVVWDETTVPLPIINSDFELDLRAANTVGKDWMNAKINEWAMGGLAKIKSALSPEEPVAVPVVVGGE